MSDHVVRKTGAEDIIWDLSDLYQSSSDPSIEQDLNEANSRAERLGGTYKGRISDLEAEEMRDLIEEYERIQEISQKVGAYANLYWSTNTEDPARGALLQKVAERSAQLSQKLIFVDLEWANAPENKAKFLIGNPILEKYHHWMEIARRYRPHLLTEPEEKILSEKAVTGRLAWTRFFDETQGAARYEWDGEMLPQQVVLGKLYEPDRDVRQHVQESVTKGLKNLSRITTYIFNNMLADKASDDRLRKYPTWISDRNLSNEVDDATVEALIGAVTSRYDIVARYYRLKRRLLNFDELFDYDRYAPLPAADRFYPWEEGKSIVLTAYGEFHPRMAEIAEMFFDGRWIDAAIAPGKESGAYCASTIPSLHPYILVNYEAKPRDVTTLAHELGHGVHGYLARERGLLQAQTPLTTAETASVFGEMLVFQDLLRRETDPSVRLAMLTRKLEDSFATVFRQVAMNRFEDAIHTARRNEGELPTERFNELWMDTQKAMFKNSVTLTDNYSIWWSYIPHFLHVPGYVYAYSFGELLVLALYARYQEVGAGFADAYLNMLSQGGSNWPNELVKPMGIDLADPSFWTHGLQILDNMVSEAENLAEKTHE